MSDREKPTNNISTLLTPEKVKSIFGFAAAFVGLLLLQFESYPPIVLAVMVIAFVISVWYNKIGGIYMILAAVLLFRMFNVSDRSTRELRTLFLDDVALAIVYLLFAGLCFRYFETFSLTNTFYPQSTGNDASRRKRWRFPSLFRGRWWILVFAVAWAVGLLAVVPFDRSVRSEYWIMPGPGRLIFLLGVIFLIWFVTRGLILLASRWTMSPQQADLVCRSNLIRQHWRELRGIEKRRVKFKIRQAGEE